MDLPTDDQCQGDTWDKIYKVCVVGEWGEGKGNSPISAMYYCSNKLSKT